MKTERKHLSAYWILILTLAIGFTWEDKAALAQDSKAVELESVTVTATKTETDPEAVPFTVRSANREDIEAQPGYYMNNIGELIRDLPGVHVAQYYPWGPPWIHLRGTGYFIGRTLYLIDGLPTHSFLSTAINPHDVEQMDVILGPSSALYGPNASGGAVNVITRKGQKNMGATTEIAYGSEQHSSSPREHRRSCGELALLFILFRRLFRRV